MPHPSIAAVAVRILLWHGYLLGGTGSNVYTRALAREWTRAGHDVTVFSQEPRAGAATTSAARAVVRPDVGGLLPVFVLDRYEGYEVKLVQDCTRAELDDWVERNAARCASTCPPTSSSRTTSCSAGPVGAAAARASRSRRTAPSSSTRCAATRRCRRGGGRRSRGGGGLRRLGAHPRGARGRRRPRRPRPRGAAGRRRRRVAPAPARGGARRPARGGRGATRRTPATRTSGCRTRGTPSGWPRSSPATSRRSSTSASCSTTRASTSCSRRSGGSTRAP